MILLIAKRFGQGLVTLLIVAVGLVPVILLVRMSRHGERRPDAGVILGTDRDA